MTVPMRVKCLLVDDRAENLLALSTLLRRDDVETLEARSGAEALDLLLAHDVALALLDVHMPDMDGFELAELMRGSTRTRDVPIIFVTAGVQDQVRIFRGYDSGAVDFLYKPIEPQVLRSKAGIFFQLDRQRQQLALELEAKTETLHLNELFVGVLGHDLRNPLTTVLTSAEYLRQFDDPKVAKIGGWIHTSGERMSRLIEDTLDLVRVRVGGGIQVHAAPMDLGEVVGRIVDEHRVGHPDHPFTFEHDGNLAGSWDAERVAQVASNLIGNALRHGTAGTPISVAVRGAGGVATLAVTNSGNVAEDVLPQIFDPFRGTRDRHRGRYGGLGLGLYIVQQIVLAHGGRIDVRTGDGTTTFTVELPQDVAVSGGHTEPRTASA